jgi:localization factor PodJL
MTNQSPWSIKGIKTGTRDAIKGMAAQQGLTIGEIINNLIEDADSRIPNKSTPIYAPVFDPNFQVPQAAPVMQQPLGQNYNLPQMQAPQMQTPQMQAPQNYNPVQSPVNHGSMMGNVMMGGNAAAQIAPSHFQQSEPHLMQSSAPSYNHETSRLALAMEELNRKLENVANTNIGNPKPANSAPYFKDEIEQAERIAERAVSSLLERVEENEYHTKRGFEAVTSTLKDVRQAQETIASRLKHIEADDPSNRSIEALRTLEHSLSRLASQIASTEERTEKIARDLEEERNHRLSPQDVERILDGSINSVNEKIESKLGEVQGRLQSIEEIATMSIEQTDKGISLLSERVKDQEALNSRTTETVKDALIDLSARITQIEGQAPEQVKDALDARFSGLVRRIEEIDNSVENFVHNSQAELEAKFANLARVLEERFSENEKETIGAIENLGNQLVKTAQSIDERVKSLEEINDNAKDHGLAMRIELGRISHAIDARLSAIENRDDNLSDKAGEHITQLAQQVTNRLNEAEEKSNEFINRVMSENRALMENLNQSQGDFIAGFDSKLFEFDRRITQKMDDKFSSMNLELRSIENNAKNSSQPLQRTISDVLERLEAIEGRGKVSFTETISPPANYAPSNSPLQANANQMQGFGAQAFDNSNAFGEFGADESFANGIVPSMANAPNDAFLYDAESLNNEFNQGINIDEAFGYDNGLGDEPWSRVDESSVVAKPTNDYLNQARRAAIEAAAAANPSKKQAPQKAQKAQKKTKPSGKNDAETIVSQPLIEENLFEESFDDVFAPSEAIQPKAKPNKAPKEKITTKNGGLSPLGKVAAGTLAIATLSTGFIYYNQHKAPKQNELPQSLIADPMLNAQPPQVNAPIAPVDNGQIIDTSNALGVSNQVQNVAAPANPPIVSPQQNNMPIATNASVANPPPKELSPKTPAANPATIKMANYTAPMPQAAPIVKPNINPAPNPNNIAPVRIAGSAPIPNAAPQKVQANNLANNAYEQALAKQKSGDNSGAVKLFAQAAESGDARAQNRLAKMYERGEGVNKNLAEARKWTERAAQSGSKQALHNLGVYYAEGAGTAQDFGKAAENFRKAASRGLTDSQYNLAAMHEQGLGTVKSSGEAYYWYSLAAKRGDADAVKKAKDIASKLNSSERNALDKKIATFKAEASPVE